MAPLPALPLGPRRLGGRGKLAGDSGGGTEHRGVAERRQVKAELEVLNDEAAGELGATNRRPRKRHAGAHQLARQAERLEPERSQPVFHAPGEFGHALVHLRVRRRDHKVEGLRRSLCRGTGRSEYVNGVGGNTAIGIDYDHDIGRHQSNVTEAEIQRVAFTASLRSRRSMTSAPTSRQRPPCRRCSCPRRRGADRRRGVAP